VGVGVSGVGVRVGVSIGESDLDPDGEGELEGKLELLRDGVVEPVKLDEEVSDLESLNEGVMDPDLLSDAVTLGCTSVVFVSLSSHSVSGDGRGIGSAKSSQASSFGSMPPGTLGSGRAPCDEEAALVATTDADDPYEDEAVGTDPYDAEALKTMECSLCVASGAEILTLPDAPIGREAITLPLTSSTTGLTVGDVPAVPDIRGTGMLDDGLAPLLRDDVCVMLMVATAGTLVVTEGTLVVTEAKGGDEPRGPRDTGTDDNGVNEVEALIDALL
jgi:hypothetical protein